MADITVAGDMLEVQVTGWDRIWALKSHLSIPLAHLAGADLAGDEARQLWKGLKMPGTAIPGVITAGTFYKSGNRVFWDVHDAGRAVAIHLHDDQYAELIIQVDDPAAAIALINGLARQ